MRQNDRSDVRLKDREKKNKRGKKSDGGIGGEKEKVRKSDGKNFGRTAA